MYLNHVDFGAGVILPCCGKTLLPENGCSH